MLSLIDMVKLLIDKILWDRCYKDVQSFVKGCTNMNLLLFGALGPPGLRSQEVNLAISPPRIPGSFRPLRRTRIGTGHTSRYNTRRHAQDGNEADSSGINRGIERWR